MGPARESLKTNDPATAKDGTQRQRNSKNQLKEKILRGI